MARPSDTEDVELGRISGVFGVRGEVRLFLHHRETELLREPRSVVLEEPDGTRHRVTLSARPGAGKRVLGRIVGVDDREAAAARIGWTILVPAAELPPVEDGEFYVWQVEGLPVEVGGEPVGTVAAVHPTGPVDVFEIRPVRGGEPWFVPCLAEVVLEVDVAGGRVVLAPEALESP